jgi:two-component system cell cycle response regulator
MARVLVIEDNSANLELMVYLLRAFGHVPIAARDGQAGLEAAQIDRPDLILCDLQMPVMDGFAVARALKRDPALRPLPLVAVTAFAMVGDREKVLAAGFDGYIPKPIVPELFVQQAEAFLAAAPRSSGPPAPGAAQPSPAPPPADKGTVLVVDDVPVNVELLRGILEPSGYVVRAVYPVRAALESARAQPPDLIISDWRMPTEDGLALLQSVQGDPLLKHIPVIIHTASAIGPRDEANALALGAAQFIPRPVDPRRLLQAVAACLAAHRPGAAATRAETER